MYLEPKFISINKQI